MKLSLLFSIYIVSNSLTQIKQPIWMDLDTGIDDAIALISVALQDQFQILGISSVGGNTKLQRTTQNTLDILHAIGRDDVDVYQGSNKLISGKKTKVYLHDGKNGLNDVEIPKSQKQAITQNSFQKIKDKILQSERKVTVVLLGPETNWCYLLRDYPQISKNIQRIIVMGGALGRGNISPAAQFNVLYDPQSVQCVLENKSQIPYIMIPLEPTSQMTAQEDVFSFFEQYKNELSQALLKILKSSQAQQRQTFEKMYPQIFDAGAIFYLFQPEQYQMKKARIVVDTYPISYGRTNIYFDGDDQVAIQIKDKNRFWSLLKKELKQFFQK